MEMPMSIDDQIEALLGRLLEGEGIEILIRKSCACRKSNTHIQMMESAKKWRGYNATNGMYSSRHRRVLVD
jgi:hypothetical protein